MYTIDITKLPYKNNIIHTEAMNGGVGIIYQFNNGYQASVVMHNSSYGGADGLIEIAAMRNKTIVDIGLSQSDEVVGWLTYEEAGKVLHKISKHHQRTLKELKRMTKAND